MRLADLETTLPRLSCTNAGTPAIELFSGKKAITNVMMLIVNSRKPYCAYGGVEAAYRQNYLENLHVSTALPKRGPLGRVLLSPGEKTLLFVAEEYRVAAHALPAGVCTIICEDVVAIFTWGASCSCVRITGRQIADDYRLFFDGLWNRAKPVRHALASITLKL
jgi:hypothetical protein